MPSVQVICPPNSLLTGSVITAITGAIDRAFRESRIGGTLDGHFISLVPTGTYVWFSTTSSLGLWGVDPATHTSNLGTGYRCVLSGNCDAAQVAEHLRYTVSLIPNFSASRINATASLSGTSVNYLSCTTGTPWTSRGFADLRGLRQRSSTGNNGNTNAIVAQPLAVPGISGSRLKGMRIGRTVAGGAIRAAVYYSQTGASTTDPNGSVLLYDFGQTQGNVTEGYDYVYVSGTYPTIPTTGTIWLTFKGNGSQGNNLYQLHGSCDASNCDFPLTSSWISDAGADPSVAFPTTFSAAGSNPFAIVMDAAICFDSPPYAGAGDLQFRYGSHVSASAYGSEIGITGTLSMRGVPPPIGGLRVVSQSIGIGSTHTSQFRMGLYAGGSTIANPLSATLVNDSNQTTGATTNAYVTLSASNAFRYLPSTSSIIAPIVKGNDGTIYVLFAANAQESSQNPGYNPSDWMASSEYETFSTASGGQMNPDESVAFPALFATGSNDQRPTNFPAFHVLFRVDGFSFAQGGDDPTGSAPQNLDSTLASATYQVGNSSLALSTVSLPSSVGTGNYSVGNSSLSLSTVSFSPSVGSGQFNVGNASLSLSTLQINSTAPSSTFILGTSSISLSALALASTIANATWTVGDATISGGAAVVEQTAAPDLFSISQICRRLI